MSAAHSSARPSSGSSTSSRFPTVPGRRRGIAWRDGVGRSPGYPHLGLQLADERGRRRACGCGLPSCPIGRYGQMNGIVQDPPPAARASQHAPRAPERGRAGRSQRPSRRAAPGARNGPPTRPSPRRAAGSRTNAPATIHSRRSGVRTAARMRGCGSQPENAASRASRVGLERGAAGAPPPERHRRDGRRGPTAVRPCSRRARHRVTIGGREETRAGPSAPRGSRQARDRAPGIERVTLTPRDRGERDREQQTPPAG